MNVWMIKKNSMKLHFLKKYFYSNLIMEGITNPDYVYG